LWAGEGADAAVAISILQAMAVDVVITDLRMSAIADGMELARYVRAHCDLAMALSKKS
jgi:YesN/AraC family two-component response regulator